MNNFYGEFNIDKLIRDKYFKDFDYKGVIIEVGAATPNFISTTKHFKESGWRAINIEPNPDFVKLHKECGNEIYQFACGEFDKDDVDFTVVSVKENNSKNSKDISDHAYSSFSIKQEYINIDTNFFNSLKKKTIKVNCRKLDTIISDIGLSNIDILSIDTEGWEIEVMKGLTIILPKLIIIENLLHLKSYNDYMESQGYFLSETLEHNYIYIKNN